MNSGGILDMNIDQINNVNDACFNNNGCFQGIMFNNDAQTFSVPTTTAEAALIHATIPTTTTTTTTKRKELFPLHVNDNNNNYNYIKEQGKIEDFARKLQAEEMNNLSLKERDEVYEDMHGVSKTIKETNELITMKLKQFDIEINKIKFKYNAIQIAEQININFVNDIKFRIMFLRSTHYNIKEATNKFVQFFELKLQLFGIEKLTKSITIDDLSDEELNCLKSGTIQLFPFRDRAGRAIIASMGQKNYKLKSVNAMVNAIWYFLMAMLEDEETQKNGIVNVFYVIQTWKDGNNDDTTPDPSACKLMWRLSNFPGALPIRNSCTHFCFEKIRIFALAAAFFKNNISRVKARMRFHHGSHTECQFSLMTYGIPIHGIPVNNKGDLRVDNHLKWIKRRKIIEQQRLQQQQQQQQQRQQRQRQQQQQQIDLPTRYDVLHGRGTYIQNYIGNEYLRELIRNKATEYKVAERGKKPYVADTIIQHIQNNLGGRFLKQDPKNGWWYEVTNDVAREKVCSSFRTYMSRCENFSLSLKSSTTTATTTTTTISSSSDVVVVDHGGKKRLRI